nr:MAG TPA: hypothetical protein [Bacteriophage sp.]
MCGLYKKSFAFNLFQFRMFLNNNYLCNSV